MKKLFVKIALVALIAGPVLTACKKGENDPFLSLRSRKARLTGEWKLVKGEIKYTSGGSTTTIMFTETELTIENGSGSNTTSYSETIDIEKDYTYETKITDDGDNSTEKGSWAFLGKNKELDLKKKEAVVFYTSSSSNGSSTDTWKGVENGYTMIIDQLKNKEMVFMFDESSTSGGTTTVTKGTMTYEKQK